MTDNVTLTKATQQVINLIVAGIPCCPIIVGDNWSWPDYRNLGLLGSSKTVGSLTSKTCGSNVCPYKKMDTDVKASFGSTKSVSNSSNVSLIMPPGTVATFKFMVTRKQKIAAKTVGYDTFQSYPAYTGKLKTFDTIVVNSVSNDVQVIDMSSLQFLQNQKEENTPKSISFGFDTSISSTIISVSAGYVGFSNGDDYTALNVYTNLDFNLGGLSFQDFIAKNICMDTTIQRSAGSLSLLAPGTQPCDRFVTNYCQSTNNADNRCACIQEQDEYKKIYEPLGISAPIQCLGKCAAIGYKTANMDGECNAVICTNFVNLTGDSAFVSGNTTIVCDGKNFDATTGQIKTEEGVVIPTASAISDPSSSPSVSSPSSSSAVKSQTYVYIGIGVLFAIVFVIWVVLAVRNSKLKKKT